jgi:hypothetical protein
MPAVTLENEHLTKAHEIGQFRRQRGIERGRETRWGQTRNVKDELVGAQGEAAVALYFGEFDEWYQRQVEDTWGPDMKHYEVRATDWPNGGLIVHPDEKNEGLPFVLACRTLRFEPYGWWIAGWLEHEEALRFPLRTMPRGNEVHYCPQGELHPMDEFPREAWGAQREMN